MNNLATISPLSGDFATECLQLISSRLCRVSTIRGSGQFVSWLNFVLIAARAQNATPQLSLYTALVFENVIADKIMKLGCFSISLAVKDLKKSKAFYEKIGFEVFGGEESLGFLIMKNGDTNIGLFQGMFEKNILSFNPGWNQNAENVELFDDVRQLLKQFKSNGIEIAEESITGEQGPSSFSIIDPDGNSILIDQHV